MCIHFFLLNSELFFFPKAISSLKDPMAMFDDEPDGSVLQPQCQEAWQEL